MKRLLLPLLAALALPTAVNANVDPRINQICMSATDYKGCVELYTKKFTLPKCNTFRKTKCTGEIKYTNATYVGEKSNEKEHGFGTLYWNNGTRYVGQFVNGEMLGQGTYIWASGARYVGQFKNGKKHGQGTYFYKDGSSWSGEWRNDEKTKNGSYTKSPEEKAFENQLKLDLIRQSQQRSNNFYRSIMGW